MSAPIDIARLRRRLAFYLQRPHAYGCVATDADVLALIEAVEAADEALDEWDARDPLPLPEADDEPQARDRLREKLARFDFGEP